MKYALNSQGLIDTKADCLVIAIPEKGDWSASADAADQQLDGQLRKLVKSGDFNPKQGNTLLLPLADQFPWARVLLVGAGKLEDLSVSAYRKIIAGAIGRLSDSASKHALITLAEIAVKDRDEAWRVGMITRVTEESLYQFAEYKSKKPNKLKLAHVTVNVSGEDRHLTEALKNGEATGQGMNVARDLGNTPPNVCNPEWLAKQAKALGKKHDNLTVEVLGEKEMKELGMNCALSVSAGSTQPARLIVMNYQGGKSKDKPHVLVGKGITFDSGGISIKPGAGMDEMKYDMCGAASVFGTMTAITELKPKINVIGVVIAAENMPDGSASRPGDIVTTMSGQTVENLNTDAEGRLVLCDALTYVERFKPASVIDIATLTGACVVALGNQCSAVMSNDDALAQKLVALGEQNGDRTWQMPLYEEYQRQLDSNFADMQNIGGPGAGAITAACFLSRFTKDYTWAHLDIAGIAWLTGKEKGATGRPVPLLLDYVLSHVS